MTGVGVGSHGGKCPLPINTYAKKKRKKEKHPSHWWRERHLFESSMGKQGQGEGGGDATETETKGTER